MFNTIIGMQCRLDTTNCTLDEKGPHRIQKAAKIFSSDCRVCSRQELSASEESEQQKLLQPLQGWFLDSHRAVLQTIQVKKIYSE